MSTESCIYEGTIRHRRRQPAHAFEHRIALLYLDLAELPELLGGRLLSRRPGPLRFRRRDYLGDASLPLEQSVRDCVQAATGARPAGAIRVLTQLRSFGHWFNPVSFYYCFAREGDRVEAIVAEVTNTPWGERHAYVLSDPRSRVGVLEAKLDKALHVSPFMAMDHGYLIRAGTPGDRLSVHIESRRGTSVAFDATLALRRAALTERAARSLTLRYPFAGARVLALIYGHAIGLKLAGATVYQHPRSRLRPARTPLEPQGGDVIARFVPSGGDVIDRFCRQEAT